MSFVNLHTHSYFSLMDSISSPKDIVSKVKSMGQTAVALSDHGVTSGLIETYKQCKKQGIHFVFGVEHYLVPDVTIKERGYSHIMMWAKNDIGYFNLKEITKIANEYKYFKPRIDIDIIRKHSEGIAISTACLGGWLRVASEWAEDGSVTTYAPNYDLLEKFIAIFPGDLYVELHTYSTEEQKQWNLQLVEVAQKYNLPVLAAVDSHYINKEDAYVHKMWLTAGKEREDGYYQIPDFYLHSEEDVREKLSYLPSHIVEEAIANTQILADSCDVNVVFGEQHYPTVDVEDKKEAVLQICRDNFFDKVPDKSERPKHSARVLEETPILEKAEYFSYFLIMHWIITTCKMHGINIAPDSRGSAGGCEVAYLMDIHKTDPIKYDLMFARFLHEERITPCDIDLDVSQRDRGKLIELIKDKYGHDRVFQAITYGFMAARGAFKRAGKALGFNPQLILEWSKLIPKHTENDEDDFKGAALEHFILDNLEKSIVAITKPEQHDGISKLISLSKSFVGILQSYGVHASAVIVFPDNPSNYTAIKENKGNFITEYEFHTLEDLGILKLDILGIKTIDVIYDTLKLIDNPPDIINLPPCDTATFDMLCEGKTAGVFQIEGNGFTGLVKKIQPRCFEDLAPLMAVYRPAIISAGLLETYINRKIGEEPVEYLHPDLEPLLNKTYGLAVYQENIIEIAKVICGYTPGQADLIRRACGRKLPEEMAEIKPEFIRRGVAKGYSENFITQLFELIEYFAGYGFGKAHTYGYGTRAYITAYLKANYPKEYMVSLINSEDKQEDIIPYIKECKKLGITVLPPDARCKNMQWIIEGDSIRMGIGYIKGLGKNTTLDNVDTLESVIRSNSKNVVIGLIKAGALDYLGDRGAMFASIESLQDTMKRIDNCNAKIKENQEALALATSDKDIKKYSRQLKDWQGKLAEAKSKEIQSNGGFYDSTIGEIEVLGYSEGVAPNIKVGKLTNVFSKTVKNGKVMAWLTLKSDYGEFRCAVFQEEYFEFKDLIEVGGTYLFVCKETAFGYNLEEISVNGVVYRKAKKAWSGR